MFAQASLAEHDGGMNVADWWAVAGRAYRLTQSISLQQCWSYDNFINHGMNEIFGKRAFSLWIMEKGLKTRLKTMERFSIIGP
jgi:hypothetical protein